MAVIAHCSGCDDEHPLSDRPTDESTAAATVCPVCGDTGYESESTDGEVVKSEAERISDAVANVYGVGDETRRNIVEHYSVYAGLKGADVDELTDIDGVGERTAENIIDATQ